MATPDMAQMATMAAEMQTARPAYLRRKER
jgi:hypothetical protein